MRTDYVRLAVAGLALLYSLSAFADAEPSGKKKPKYIATEIIPPADASCAEGFGRAV